MKTLEQINREFEFERNSLIELLDAAPIAVCDVSLSDTPEEGGRHPDSRRVGSMEGRPESGSENHA